ncbi:MAG: histidine phosphatase family protein [Clostridia bacterium]|nr:histidine phosphatase family protein [Clostridia bacterium]
MTRIIAVRHAQSEGNLAHFSCGQIDIALTPFGRLQAEETARFLDRYQIDRLYSSDLIRVLMTARPTAARQGLEIIRKTGLREICAGDWEGFPHKEIDRRYPEQREIWHHRFADAACPGGESVRQLYDRIRAAFDEIVAENPGRTVAVFTHATPVRAMLTVWRGQPFAAMTDTPWPPNASVTVAECRDDGSVHLEYAAYQEHLIAAGLAGKKIRL